MLLLASSVCGLFKWRQFEPEMICWQWGGTCAFPFRTATSRSCSTSGLARRSRHRLEVGPTLRPGNSAPIATAAPTDQRQLARGRDLHPGQGQVGLFYIARWIPLVRPSTSFFRPSATTAAAKRFSSQSLGRCEPYAPSGHQHRQGRRLPARHRGTQSRGRSSGKLPASTGAISQPGTGTGSSGDQASGPRESAFSLLLGSLAARSPAMKAIPYNPQRPSVLDCGECEVGLLHLFILDLFAATS